MAEDKRGTEAGNPGAVSEEFGPEQTRFESSAKIMRETIAKIDEALKFAYECGYRAGELGLSMEQGYKIFMRNLDDITGSDTKSAH